MAEGKKEQVREVVLESGIPVKPRYGPEDLQGFDYACDLGDPGEYPYTRGIHPLMYRYRPWTMRQYLGFGTPRESNERFRYLISIGQNALNVAFDLPSQMGLDSDDPLAEGEVGRVGMAVDSLRDMEEAFDRIPLGEISTSLTINAPAAVMMAMYLAVAEKQGLPRARVAGTAQNDILKEYIGRGAWVYDIDPSIRMIGDTIEFCAREAPRYNPVSVCGYHIRESGATPAQEIGYAYCIAMAYIDDTLARGLTIDEVAPRFTFNFNIYGNLWEQVAKFRAARRLWARLMRDHYGAREPRSMWMRMIAGGGGSGLTIREPENNLIRGAYYALASALGGAQTMALCCYDEGYTIPSAKASKLSLRTMQILAEEMGLSDTVDPLAGSYYIETLTSQMEEKIREAMREVERWGGIVKAVAEGLIQRKVSIQAYQEQRALKAGQVVKVGVNKYVDPTEQEPDILLYEFDPKLAEGQIARLNEVRRTRHWEEVRRCLEGLRQQARGQQNLMPAIIDAVRAYATLGEITAVFKDTFGEFREPVAL
ncbi:MAG: methylmalonyl-CoA mutase [Deltaproteobacteria bacterium]|nr:methylmalonyl-CoA mutase [Deltaproteobacteria bacterium]MBI3077164.1 methylmalonyl-CoA mutase [Deltaproteobacteria bacterium]